MTDSDPVEDIEIVSREVMEHKYPDEEMLENALEEYLRGLQCAYQRATTETDTVRLQQLYERQREEFEGETTIPAVFR